MSKIYIGLGDVELCFNRTPFKRYFAKQECRECRYWKICDTWYDKRIKDI